MSEIVFVTGGTGLLGNNVIRALIERGDRVRALVRSTSTPDSLAGLDVELIHGDLSDRDALQRGCDGASRVIHSAGSVAIGWKREPMFSINVEGTRSVAQAAMAAGCRMVHVSSVDALAIATDPNHPVSEESPLTGEEVPCNYVLSKREANNVISRLRSERLDAVIVYPGFMLGPNDWKPSSGRMLQAVGRQFTPVAPSGGCSVCDVRDVSAAIVAASSASHGQEHSDYILAGHNVDYFELWTRMATVAGSRPPAVRMGPMVRRIVGAVGDVVGRLVRSEPELNSAMLAMSAQLHYYSSERAQRELGYQIRDLDETLRDAWSWLASNG
ncbi:MAG: NAD-dependent epimerase/dehydratase family protein [Planctomycetota bacterium]